MPANVNTNVNLFVVNSIRWKSGHSGWCRPYVFAA